MFIVQATEVFNFLRRQLILQYSKTVSLKVRLHWRDFAGDFALSLLIK
jgi:hypothetical protein